MNSMNISLGKYETDKFTVYDRSFGPHPLSVWVGRKDLEGDAGRR